jgi:hypothetical protein
MQASRVTRFAVLTENYSALKFHAPGDLASQRPSAVKTVSKLNGISVATLDTKGPVSSLSLVAVSGGSRSDSPSFPGVSHFWKNLLIRVSFFYSFFSLFLAIILSVLFKKLN